MPHHGSGPIPAKVMIVGEAWGEYEEQRGEPFVGPSGEELNRMLQEAGLMRSQCFVTNLVNKRPPNSDLSFWISEKKNPPGPEFSQLRGVWAVQQVHVGYQQLMAEIELVQPSVIIACGNWAMWALTGKRGITSWRGSVLKGPGDRKVIAAIHPAAIQRMWSWRSPTVSDFRRAKRHLDEPGWNPPAWKFQIRPDLTTVLQQLNNLLTQLNAGSLWLDVDLETAMGHLACCGVSWSTTEAICVPFMTRDNKEGYWGSMEEAAIVWQFYRIFTHPNANIRWQNGLYDAQYIYKHWHFVPRGAQDTMISQHAMFSDLPKSLAFQASMYAKWYVYWKDEGKNIQQGGSEEEHWRYNCQDCIYTREAGEAELQMVETFQKTSWPAAVSVHSFQQAMFYPVLKAMLKGVAVSKKERDRLAFEVQEQITHREDFLRNVIGHPLNTASPKQMQALFYEDLGQPPIKTRPTKYKPATITCNDEALQKIAAREPLLKPIINCISDIRTFDLFLSNFILARLDEDGRMRCSYNIGGSESGKSAPKTYRLSSSKSAFGSGTNLQTIPSEKSKSLGKAAARGHVAMLGDPYTFPNLRAMFIPDPGFAFFDMDLDRADLQVVVWETDDEMLKAALRMGTDIHLLNAFIIEGKEPPPLEELVESHPRYADHKGPMKHKREFAKVFCHATNYVGSPRTIAGHLGRSVVEIERAQKIWFGAHPGIKKWHDRISLQINKHRFVENKFGYRWYIFDRVDTILPEAVAWIPQSTVSIVINKIWMNLFQNRQEAEWSFDIDFLRSRLLASDPCDVLLQVHDSLAGQFPTYRKEACVARMLELSKIVIPYDDPLIIPTGVNCSEVSWGAC